MNTRNEGKYLFIGMEGGEADNPLKIVHQGKPFITPSHFSSVHEMPRSRATLPSFPLVASRRWAGFCEYRHNLVSNQHTMHDSMAITINLTK